MTAKDLPNLISIARILLVAPVVLSLLEEAYALALGLFLVAGASDALDGFLAKRYGWESRLGTLLDPLADKALLVSLYVVLGWQEHVPWWLVAAVIARDLVILLGALAFHWFVGRYDMAPSVLSKINTFTQIFFGFLVLALLALGEHGPDWVTPLSMIVLTTTLLSGMDYVWTWGVRAWRVHHDAR